MLAIRRMKSDDKKERFLGYQNLAFIALFFMALSGAIFYHDIGVFPQKWRFAFLSLTIWAFISILWTKDTQKENKYHKNTLKNYIQSLNLGLFAAEKSDSFLKNISLVSVILFGVVTVVATMLACIICLIRPDLGLSSGAGRLIVFIMLFNVFLFVYGIAYLTETMKKLPISFEKLKGIHNVEDLLDEYKEYFIRKCDHHVDEKGYVSQEDVCHIIMKINEHIEERAKKEEIKKKKLEYQKAFKV